MRKYLARLLRRQANRLDPPKPFVYGNTFTNCTAGNAHITYGKPGDVR